LYLCAPKVLKKTVIILFLACIVLQSGFMAVYTMTGIWEHKRQVKALLRNELRTGKFDAELVVFTEKQLEHAKWEHSKEFFLGQEKYDVVRVHETNGQKTYECINDKKEMALYKTLDKHKTQDNVLEKVLKKFCQQVNSIEEFQSERNYSHVSHADYFSQDYSYGYSKTHFRPPTGLA
jgi:hypothetical protein